MAKITVIGSMNVDNVANMERFPEAGESVIGTELNIYPGGKGANQCVAVARLGGDVEMVGMLGSDSGADMFRRIFREEGIKADNVFTSKGISGTVQIQVNAEGQNRICIIPGANNEFGEAELEMIDGLLKETELVMLQHEMRLDIVEEIIRRAHSYGKKVLLNPAPAAKLDERVVAMVDYLTPNETELSVITGMPTESDDNVKLAAEKLLKSGTKAVIATLGSRGALVATKEEVRVIPGYKVKAVDTTAAGDSFNGALAVALTEGKSLDDAVRFANAMGALTVQRRGAIPSLHTRSEVEKFITLAKVNKNG